MPGMDGIEVLDQIIAKYPETAVVMISGHGDIETAVDCIKKGAYDFISKPPDLNRLLNTVRNALDRHQLATEVKVLKKKVSKQYEMIGSSSALSEVREMIDKVAPTEARVLVMGPNGSGKELVAHHIHEKSERSKAPLIEVNCAAIPSELIESELFGHKKGAFTSAVKDRKGKFELANGGTLFLDEIGDMSLSAQAKVLRALQESKITPVGGDKEIKVDVRVVAATNKDLQKEIADGKFREDLYHRLGVIVIRVPGLNDRKEDIPELAEHFGAKISEEQGIAPKKINEKAISALKDFDWSGNIREFRNVMERLYILGGTEISEVDVQRYARK
ncbi:MAG: sigma-54-dependent Fis family transcriptional regulator, partial [Flavobacteriia bacterium]|nr:sigma-54-dependent Fis family transcriptional regulator [Flavobacteriia bacterium]